MQRVRWQTPAVTRGAPPPPNPVTVAVNRHSESTAQPFHPSMWPVACGCGSGGPRMPHESEDGASAATPEHAGARGGKDSSHTHSHTPPPCDIPSGCCSFTRPWTVTRSSLRMLRRVAAFCRPLQPVLLLVSFPRSRSPVVGVPGAVLNVRWCAVCASAAPNSWRIEDVLVVAGACTPPTPPEGGGGCRCRTLTCSAARPNAAEQRSPKQKLFSDIAVGAVRCNTRSTPMRQFNGGLIQTTHSN